MTYKPTTVLASLIVGGAVGYYLGFNAALSSTASSSSGPGERRPSSSTLPPPVVPDLKEAEPEQAGGKDEDSSEDEGPVTSGMGGVKAGMFEECKLVSAGATF